MEDARIFELPSLSYHSLAYYVVILINLGEILENQGHPYNQSPVNCFTLSIIGLLTLHHFFLPTETTAKMLFPGSPLLSPSAL
jgi:hypothetical protein